MFNGGIMCISSMAIVTLGLRFGHAVAIRSSLGGRQRTYRHFVERPLASQPVGVRMRMLAWLLCDTWNGLEHTTKRRLPCCRMPFS